MTTWETVLIIGIVILFPFYVGIVSLAWHLGKFRAWAAPANAAAESLKVILDRALEKAKHE